MKVVKRFSVTVLGRKLKVIIRKPDDSWSDYGEYFSNTDVIWLNADQKPEALTSSLFHELIHAALHISGCSYLLKDEGDEAVTRAIENALAP